MKDALVGGFVFTLAFVAIVVGLMIVWDEWRLWRVRNV